VRPLVLTFGSPEFFMLAIVGIAFIASLSGRGPRGLVRGFLTGCLGLLLAAVGQDPQQGIQRYTLQQLYLWNGLDLVPVLVGFFAIPEIIDLAVRGTAIAADAPLGRLSQVRDGVIDAFRHIWLIIRCSLIGTYIGIIPGVGGGVAQWIAYAHAVQSAKTPAERDGFGKGDVRGVLGPGAAVNSKEGGALIPTIAFGVPGSTAMAILLGGFFVVGLVPGPDMLTKHLDVTMSMVWTIVLANIITVVVSVVFLNRLARLTNIRGGLLIPFLALLTFLGAYTSSNSLNDIVVTLIFGWFGYLMVRYRWPRAPLVLGLVLGGVAERYLWISVARYGSAWLKRPLRPRIRWTSPCPPPSRPALLNGGRCRPLPGSWGSWRLSSCWAFLAPFRCLSSPISRDRGRNRGRYPSSSPPWPGWSFPYCLLDCCTFRLLKACCGR